MICTVLFFFVVTGNCVTLHLDSITYQRPLYQEAQTQTQSQGAALEDKFWSIKHDFLKTAQFFWTKKYRCPRLELWNAEEEEKEDGDGSEDESLIFTLILPFKTLYCFH